eukprot:g4219.t1
MGATSIVTQLLISAGVKSGVDSLKMTPLHLAAQFPPSKSEDDYVATLLALIKASPSAASSPDVNGMLPLHIAASEAIGSKPLQIIFNAAPAAALSKDIGGRTPLMHAVRLRNYRTAADLVSSSSDSVAIQDAYNDLPTHLAWRQGAPLTLLRHLLHAYPRAKTMPDRFGRHLVDYAGDQQVAGGASARELREMLALVTPRVRESHGTHDARRKLYQESWKVSSHKTQPLTSPMPRKLNIPVSSTTTGLESESPILRKSLMKTLSPRDQKRLEALQKTLKMTPPERAQRLRKPSPRQARLLTESSRLERTQQLNHDVAKMTAASFQFVGLASQGKEKHSSVLMPQQAKTSTTYGWDGRWPCLQKPDFQAQPSRRSTSAFRHSAIYEKDNPQMMYIGTEAAW